MYSNKNRYSDTGLATLVKIHTVKINFIFQQSNCAKMPTIVILAQLLCCFRFRLSVWYHTVVW